MKRNTFEKTARACRCWSALRLRGRSDEGVGFVLDLTDRKRAEAAIRESDARMRLILDTALNSVITIDERGVITAWNAQAERMFGWGYDEAVGRSIEELLIPADVHAPSEQPGWPPSRLAPQSPDRDHGSPPGRQ